MRIETKYCDLCKKQCEELSTFQIGWYGSGVIDIDMCDECRESAEVEINKAFRELYEVAPREKKKSTGIGLFRNMINKLRA